MTERSIGVGLAFAGIGIAQLRIVIQSQMQRVVARLAPPKTNRPFKNLAEALSTKRVREEYKRLFPVRAKAKFFWMRVVTVVGIICFVTGIFLAR